MLGEQAWSALHQAGCWKEGLYLECLRAEARALIAHLQALKERVAERDRQLEKFCTQPVVAVLLTPPGVSAPSAVDRRRHRSAESLPQHPPLRGVLWISCSYPPGGGCPSSPRSRQRYNRHLKRSRGCPIDTWCAVVGGTMTPCARCIRLRGPSGPPAGHLARRPVLHLPGMLAHVPGDPAA